ncbi:DNA translocase FtsK [Neisseria gonorrhoeae]|uniref:DNA translocase FtsK n=1 Tax=Neisseria gonorrhoeae TaxID=485 RepID=UPI001923CAF5|nr:DNA translocase FtsK [Neisseria gonorrhoeae]
MFWIVLIVILLLALAGLFFVRAQSEREWMREVSAWQEKKGEKQAELPEIKDGMPDFPEFSLMLFHAVKTAVYWLFVGVVRFCRNYLAHESEPDRPVPPASANRADVPTASDGYSDSGNGTEEAETEAAEAAEEEAADTEDIATAVIDNRRIPFDRSIAEGLMQSESKTSPVRPVFKEITLEEATRALSSAALRETKKRYIDAFEKNGTAVPKVRVSDTPMEGLQIIGLDDPVLQRTYSRMFDADKEAFSESADYGFEPYFEKQHPSAFSAVKAENARNAPFRRHAGQEKGQAEAKSPDVSQGQSVSDGTAVRDARRRVSVNLKEPNKATVSAEARISRLIPESRTVVGKRDVEMPSETENVFTETVSSVGYGGPVYGEAADIHIEEPAAPDAWVVEPPEVPEVAVPEIDILPPPPVSEIYNRTYEPPAGFEQAQRSRIAETDHLAADVLNGGWQEETAAIADDGSEGAAERSSGQYLSETEAFGHDSQAVCPFEDVPSERPSCRVSDTEADEGAFQSEETGAVSEHLPTTDLLLPPLFNPEATQTEEELLENSITIEEKLAEFKVKVKVVDSYSGPVITRYEIEPDVGVRGNSVLNLEKDLARSLGVASIRVVETIPGKTCMGLELPNPKRQMIRLSEIFNSPEFAESKSKLTLALGQDITGQPVVTDLGKAPHLLVAGTTGSGKSVGVNAMILSMLFKAAPEDVRMIMIDPKMLELSIYEGITHLLAPVVTDMKLAANALNWCVNEMEKRYRLMSFMGVRNLAGFNQKTAEAAARGEKIGNPFSLTPDDPEPLEKLPFIVVVVDEFADLMMTAGKKIEELIARLAQKARAAGIHLILATQRPSVDVITGLIKANIPTRIAFQVSSKIDSRTILDQMGAENLLGQGDMLFLPPGTAYPQRVHGAFASDEEVHRVVEYLKQFGEPDYVDDILSGGGSEELPGIGRSGDGETDPMYDEAVSVVLKTRKASISGVQRALRIGYNRAARLIDQMEAEGIVSAPEHNGNRTILVPLDNA